MSLICPECRGAAESGRPTTRHAHGPQEFRHAEDGTILCLVGDTGTVATPVRG